MLNGIFSDYLINFFQLIVGLHRRDYTVEYSYLSILNTWFHFSNENSIAFHRKDQTSKRDILGRSSTYEKRMSKILIGSPLKNMIL